MTIILFHYKLIIIILAVIGQTNNNYLTIITVNIFPKIVNVI